jgi:hypothetical protein
MCVLVEGLTVMVVTLMVDVADSLFVVKVTSANFLFRA